MTDTDKLKRLAEAWDAREATFPPFTRMPWQRATPMARAAFLARIDGNHQPASDANPA